MNLTKNISLGLLAVAVLGMSSCLKDIKSNSDPSLGTNNVVEFQNNSIPVSYISIYPQYSMGGLLFNNDTAGFNINVNWAGPQFEAPQDITLTLAIDTVAMNAFNADQNVSLTVPPADVFTFPSTITIKKGTMQTITRAVITEAADFDFNASYVLPLTIKSSTYGQVSTNYGTAMFTFGGRNQYDGLYTMSGYTLRAGDATKTGNFAPISMGLATIGANSIEFNSSATGNLQVWADGTGVGVGTPVIVVNADNTVTLSSSSGIYNAPGYNSRYDPATKTFYFAFTWGAGPSSRMAIDTLVYQGPR